ncbi:MAG: MFS transporter [Oscillospiraceae bacterium]|nr:MFS transporter [Oscillospiraceae bacterium]
MAKNKKALVITIYLIAMFQMPQLALSPAVNEMKTNVFPHLSLSTIQTGMQLSSLASLLASLISAALVRAGKLTKKSVVVFGLLSLGTAGVLAFFLHTEFWHMCFLGVLIGLGTGCYLSTMTSVMIDSFPQDQVRSMTGVQTTFMECGGIIISLVGGALVSRFWYGGYLVMLVGLPLAVLAIFNVPSYSSADSGSGEKFKFKGWILLYTAVMFLFQLLYVVCGSNLAVHLAAVGITDPTITGYGSAIQMVGGGVFGLLFGKLSKRLGDFMIPLAFFVLFIGFTILNVFQTSLVLVFVGTFLIGATFSMAAAQCIFEISKRVDPSTSALPTAIIASFAPCIGAFLSPVIITNLTTALGGESTNYRYQFTAFVALAVGVIFAATTKVRKKL